MNDITDRDRINLEIAQRWCASQAPNWSVREQAGRGGTAPVFSIDTPAGERALKIYDAEFSSGEKGKIEAKRIEQQVALGVHDCPSLIKIYGGGQFEDRHFLLMNRAPGQELEKRLRDIPRAKVRGIVDQIARACMFLRERGLCHRDIKSANVFVTDDFERATLLDLSVTRDIYDPVGIGTDHDGQLPIVATARYSPPEYLFRLLEPSQELWHALDIYQLGGLLHDLIMRQPLFQNEFLRSKENRYRFAWIVATTDPTVSAADVDQDLVATARRALDKDWEKRSVLTLNDFLADTEVQRARSLEAFGLSRRLISTDHLSDTGAQLTRLQEVAKALQSRIQEYLRREGAISRHEIFPGTHDRSKLLSFEWTPSQGGALSGDVTFVVQLSLIDRSIGRSFASTATMRASVAGLDREHSIELPEVDDSTGANDRLGEQAEAVIGSLATILLQSQD